MPEKRKGQNTEARSRLEQMTEVGREIELPPCSMPWLVDWLFEAGPAKPEYHPLEHIDLRAWVDNTSAPASPWEIGAVKTLSSAYCQWLIQSRNPDQPPPWTPEITPERGEKIAKGIKRLLRE